MTERFERRPTPRWYWIAALGSVLFMAAGCFDYLVDVTKDPATLPIDRRDVIMAEPTWEIASYAVASWVGLPVSSTHIAVGAVFGVGLFREWYTRHSRRR